MGDVPICVMVFDKKCSFLYVVVWSDAYLSSLLYDKMIYDEFNDCFVHSIPVLMRHAQRLVPMGLEAEDLLQDALLRMWENQRYYHPGNFLGWGYTILYHQSLNLQRSASLSHPTLPERKDEEGYEQFCDMHYDITKAIGMLPVYYSDVIKMYLEGYSYEEIAAEQGLSIGTVKSRMSRARQQLKEILRDYTLRG